MSASFKNINLGGATLKSTYFATELTTNHTFTPAELAGGLIKVNKGSGWTGTLPTAAAMTAYFKHAVAGTTLICYFAFSQGTDDVAIADGSGFEVDFGKRSFVTGNLTNFTLLMTKISDTVWEANAV